MTALVDADLGDGGNELVCLNADNRYRFGDILSLPTTRPAFEDQWRVLMIRSMGSMIAEENGR